MEVCKAIIQEGKRKGERCQFPPKEFGYCQRHHRNKIYDDGIEEGKKWCRFFFRGCNNTLNHGELSCKPCREKLTTKTENCKHSGCKFKIIEGDFCKKHERDKYRIEEKEKNIKYCDIDRGCFTIVKDSKSCETCLAKARISDSKRSNRNRIINTISEERNITIRTCVKCSKDFEAFQTKHMKDSTKCKECYENQKEQDKKRENRVRDYNKERIDHIDSYYKTHIIGSKRRGYGDFEIDFETFSELVKSQDYPAFRSQILAISYAYFRFLLEKKGLEIDLSKIWDLGTTSEDLNEVILEVILWTQRVLTTASGGFDPAQWAKKPIAWEKIQSVISPAPPKILSKLHKLDLLRSLSFNFDVACAKAINAIEKSSEGLVKREILSEINIDENYWEDVRRSLLKDHDVVLVKSGGVSRYRKNAL